MTSVNSAVLKVLRRSDTKVKLEPLPDPTLDFSRSRPDTDYKWFFNQINSRTVGDFYGVAWVPLVQSNPSSKGLAIFRNRWENVFTGAMTTGNVIGARVQSEDPSLVTVPPNLKIVPSLPLPHL